MRQAALRRLGGFWAAQPLFLTNLSRIARPPETPRTLSLRPCTLK